MRIQKKINKLVLGTMGVGLRRRRSRGEAMGRLPARTSSVVLHTQTSQRYGEQQVPGSRGCVAEATLNIAEVP